MFTPVGIKRIRQLMGWSQERLAREAGVSFCTVNRWENGKTRPSPMALKVLARLYELSLKDNRRDSARIELRCPLEVTGLRSGARAVKDAAPALFFTAFTHNISPGGVMFAAPCTIEKGQDLRIALELNDSNCGRRINAITDVCWAARNGAVSLVGVRFNEIDPVDVSRIARLLAAS